MAAADVSTDYYRKYNPTEEDTARQKEELNAKIQKELEDLESLEQRLIKDGYTKLEPGANLEKGKVYYIVTRKYDRGPITPIKVKCIDVKPDGTGVFEGVAVGAKIYNNISLVSDNKNFFGIWNRPASLSTVFGVGSASKYGGKKSRKSRKSRKSKRKGRKARKTRRH